MCQQGSNEVCRFQEVLKIIEEQQKLFPLKELVHLLSERLISLLTQSQRLCHGLWNERRIMQSRQVNPGEAIGKTCTESMSNLEREPSLADPAWPGQGKQTH